MGDGGRGETGGFIKGERAWGQKLSVWVSGDQMGGVGPEQERWVRCSPPLPAQNMGHSQVSVHSTGQE